MNRIHSIRTAILAVAAATQIIAGLRPGTYEIEVWQEFWAAQLGTMKFSVTLEEGESKICDIVYRSSVQAKTHLR